MKNLFLSLAFVFAGTMAVNAQATMDFEKTVHDYGTIQQNDNGTCEFIFVNNGTEPLVINSAKGSCGCTVPEWPKEPIQPGESASIKVSYDTKRLGVINKTVTIDSNTDPAVTVLRIKGEVKPATDNTPVMDDSDGAPTTDGM